MSEFTDLAAAYLDDLAERHPDTATSLGDHRFDARLPDHSEAAGREERDSLDAWQARLDGLRPEELTAEQRVDAAMLANHIARRKFEHDELREDDWNPLRANPGRAIYNLLARDFGPLPERLQAVAGRLAEVPRVLGQARARLAGMPVVHLETAIGQFGGTIELLTSEVGAAIAKAGTQEGIDRVRPAALDALREHRDWLAARLDEAKAGERKDPRIGPGRFARKLSLTLDATADADAILARAESDLERVSEEIAQVAASLGGDVRQVLGRLAQDVPDDTTILRFASDALDAQTEFVGANALVTCHDDPIKIIEMPEIDRGVAVAYCDSPGPLEAVPLPTLIAVSPTPADWSAERVASFYREYNRHLVHDLMVHEAMPGHYLQLQHSRRFDGSGTNIRAALSSGAFIEGWAVYAEKVMAGYEYPGEGDPRAFRMQQLKMQLRMTINAILDARVHAHGMTEAEAMALMSGRGFQEEGEAAGKWRRAQLTSAQLSTYYVGYTEVSDLAAELKAAGAADKDVHDRILAHGSPPVRLLRTVV